MGKGFNNYMCKKFFHPASRDNLKRVWMAEQKADSYKKKQEELRVQYEKEQDLYTNNIFGGRLIKWPEATSGCRCVHIIPIPTTKKALLSKESKDKLSVNFMYEPPPGTKKEREREDDEPEYKFEWQRKFNAPREDYCKGDSEIRDQPFGIQVRNVRCIKCHKWGHINTDKECPMYNQSSSADHTGSSLDTKLLLQQMREDGLAMKKSALSLQQQMGQRFMKEENEEDEGLKQSDKELLRSLTKKQKQKLLRTFMKLEKMEKSEGKLKKKKSKKRSKNNDSDSSDSDKKKKKHKHKKPKKKSKKHKGKHKKRSRKEVSSSDSEDSDSSSSSDSEDSEKEKVFQKTKKNIPLNNGQRDFHQWLSSNGWNDARPNIQIKNEHEQKSLKRKSVEQAGTSYDIKKKRKH